MTNRKLWQTGFSIGTVSESALDRAASAGLDLVEICGIDDSDNWKKIPEWSKKSGVQVWSFHLPFSWNAPIADPATLDIEAWKQTYEQDKPLIEGCGEAGVKYMVIHPSLEPYTLEEREAHIQAAIEHLGILSDLCKKNGVTLAVEDLPRTCIGNCSDEMLRIMESNSDLRICFDVNHLFKESHVDFVKKVGKYIVTTHISDYDFLGEKHWFPMQGEINWRTLQAALELADYNGPFVYESHLPLGGTWADVPKNHQYLKNL